MSSHIKDHDKGAKRLLREIGRAGHGGRSILLGIQGKEAAEAHKGEAGGDLTVGMVAAFHELGLGVPERSWLRGWVDENLRMIEDDLRRAVRQVLVGKLTVDQAADILGVKWQASIQGRIVRGISPALDPETIKRKGSSTPLIDTGQLKSAITYVVEGAARKTGGPVVSA